MKLIGLGLISLNIFLLLPVTAMAEKSSLAKHLGGRPVPIAQADETDKDESDKDSQKRTEQTKLKSLLPKKLLG